jgi:uncharacterized protein
MTTQTILLLIMVGLIAGFLGGLVGIGGGIIIVPALVYILHFNQLQAQGSTLGMLLFPVGILGFITYYYKCQQANTPINFGVIALLGLGFFVGSFFGSKVAINIELSMLKKIFAGAMIVIACKMLFFDK